MAAGDTLATFTPQMNEPPTASFATLDTRNVHPVLEFDAAADEAAVFSATMPRNYGASAALEVILCWVADTATSGDTIWDVSFERMDAALDIDADSFAAVQSATATAPGTSGFPKYTTISFTNAQADAIVAGEMFRLKVNRDANNGSDTMAGDAQLRGIEVRQAP
jgi:hypothetical protein